MVAYLVLEFASVFERNWIHNKVAMDVLGIQMHRHKHLIPVSPHPAGRFLADLKCYLRRDLPLPKTLDSVVSYHTAAIAKAFLNGCHLRIGILLGAIDSSYEHGVVRLCIVGGIFQRVVEITV